MEVATAREQSPVTTGFLDCVDERQHANDVLSMSRSPFLQAAIAEWSFASATVHSGMPSKIVGDSIEATQSR